MTFTRITIRRVSALRTTSVCWVPQSSRAFSNSMMGPQLQLMLPCPMQNETGSTNPSGFEPQVSSEGEYHHGPTSPASTNAE